MTTDDRWKHLKTTARQQLEFVDKLTFIESVIEFNCEPSFGPIFNLQIIWTDKIVKWRMAKWDIQADRNKFYEKDGCSKVILYDPKPSVDIQVGTTTPESLSSIVGYIRQLKIHPRIDRLKMFTLDGSINKLSLGVDDLRTTYTWHTLPEEWQELEQLENMLLDFQSRL